MKVLITGLTGFIGAHIARRLLQGGHEVVGYDLAPTRARIADMAERVSIVDADICELEMLVRTMKRHEITHVVHMACFLPEALILDNPTKALRVNCEGTNNVFEAARLLGINKVVYASSNAVCPLGPQEDDPVKPTTLYGHMKHLNEVMGRHFSRHFGLETIGLRFGFNYGPGGRLLAGELQRKYGSGVLFQVLEGLMLGKTLHVDFHPQTSFDWQYVKDNARCVTLALAAPPTKRKVFDLPGEQRPFKDASDILERLVPGAKAVYECLKGMDSMLRTAELAFEIDPAIVREEIGYEPQYTLETGLAKHLAVVQELAESAGAMIRPSAS